MNRVLVPIVAGVVALTLGLGLALAQQSGPTALPPDGALAGEVVRGPTCGGPVRQGQVCESPAQATIDVLTQDGQLVAHFQSDPTGHFFIPLPPGTYTVEAAKPEDGQATTRFDVPRPPHQDVTITSGSVEQVRVSFDTGIR